METQWLHFLMEFLMPVYIMLSMILLNTRLWKHGWKWMKKNCKKKNWLWIWWVIISQTNLLLSIINSQSLWNQLIPLWQNFNEKQYFQLRQMYNLLQVEMTNAIDIGRKSNRFTRNHPAVTNAKRSEILISYPKLFNHFIRV